MQESRETNRPYRPQPIDTGGIELPTELLAVVERLAEHVHDTWAARRLAEGWSYAPRRDEERKTHPDLVPFAELPEAEKEYDRQTAIQTLKAAIAIRLFPEWTPTVLLPQSSAAIFPE